MIDNASGVAFTVSVEFVKHDCIVSREALSKLARSNPDETDLMETFRAFEANIEGVARRLVSAGVPGNPLTLGPQSFILPDRNA
jgi:hypothetical protein